MTGGYEARATEGALRLLGESTNTCTSVDWLNNVEAIKCQMPTAHAGHRHSALTVHGVVHEWDDEGATS